MRRTLLAAATIALVVACGNQPVMAGVAPGANAFTSPAPTPSATPTPTPSAAADLEEQRRKFVQCMRDNGIDLPDPGDGHVRPLPGGDVDREKLRKALETCRSLAPSGPRRKMSPQDQKKRQEFVQCMRDNGIDRPGPMRSGPRHRMRPDSPGSLDRPKFLDRSKFLDDPKVEKALEACRSLAPRAGLPR
jgi:hypothetical protein